MASKTASGSQRMIHFFPTSLSWSHGSDCGPDHFEEAQHHMSLQ